MTHKQVPVFDTQGKQLGEVSRQTTSIGVCKKYGALSAEISKRFGVWGWVVYR